MPGGFHSPEQLRRGLSLGDRAQHGHVDDSESAPELRPCWLTVSGPQPGHVLAWQASPNGTWQAVVVLTVDADRVRPRAVPDATPRE